MSPPYPNTTRRRTHQECPIPIRNTSIRSTSLLRTPEQLPSNRTPKNSAQAPYEKYKRIHSSVLPDAEDLGDERRKQRIIPAGRETVEHDESQPERVRGRGGCEDAREPEGEDAGCGEEERQDKRVLPTEPVAGVAGQDARHGVDGVGGREKVATFGGGEPKNYGVGGNEGEGELGAGRLEGLRVSYGGLRMDASNQDWDLRSTLMGKVVRVTANTVPLGKQGKGFLSTYLEKRGHSREKERRSRGQIA